MLAIVLIVNKEFIYFLYFYYQGRHEVYHLHFAVANIAPILDFYNKIKI